MTRLRLALAVLATLIVAGFYCADDAAPSMSLLGVGRGAPPTAYSGPGDAVSGAKSYWGLRCYNTAYTGNVADVYAPSDASHTLLTCSAGGIINETVQALATTCASSCTVKTLYDQSGAGNCSGACNLTQATIANRPAFVTNCVGGKPCMTFTAAAPTLMQSAVIAGGFSQANTIVTTYKSTAVAQGWIIIGQSLFAGVFAGGGSNYLASWANSGFVSGTASDNAFHAAQVVQNGASSSINVDGSQVDASNPGTGGYDNGPCVGAKCDTAEPFDGQITELGVWAGFSGGNITAMNSNQHSYWGF
jgi:hypothetical protein